MKRDIRDRGKVSIGLEKGVYGKKIESSLMNCFLRIISVFSFIFKLKVARALKFSLPALLMMVVGVGIVIGGSVIVKNGELNVSNDMSVSNDVLYVDSVNNRVGIGTTIPNWELDVVGDIRATGTICDDTGCIGIGLWTDQGSYVYPDNYNQFVITDTGYVGVGTATPQEGLDIRGDLLIPVQDIIVDCNGIIVGAGTCDSISDGTVLVGIGLDTLDFNGDNLADGSPLCTDSLSAPTIVAIDTDNDCSNGVGGGLSILGNPDGSETTTVTSAWGFKDDDSDGLLDNGEDLYIDNNPTTEYFSSGTGNAYFGGNVGIGTTSPEAKLDVDGSLVVRDELPFPSSGNGVRVGWDDAWNRGFIQAYDWDVNM